MSNLSLTVGDLGAVFDVRRVEIEDAISELFEIRVTALVGDANLLIDAAVGAPAKLGLPLTLSDDRVAWTGVCKRFEQSRYDVEGASTYEVTIVPELWLLTQRRGHRLFQHEAAPAIITKLLDEWGIEPDWRIQLENYPKLELRIQHGESDFDFVTRLLQESGISFFFERGPDGTFLVLSDAPQEGARRAGEALAAVDVPPAVRRYAYAERVRVTRDVALGSVVLADYDFRHPAFETRAKAASPDGDARFERYRYAPGSMLVEGKPGGATPSADDKGAARRVVGHGSQRAAWEVAGEVSAAARVAFRSNALDLAPGMVCALSGHPRDDVSTRPLMVSRFQLYADHDGEWLAECIALFADRPHHPPVTQLGPRIHSVVTATVVGPAGEEIHTDEFGRVRVQFPWDREGTQDDNSSCWMRVSQGWAGAGFGLLALPRVGQEVLVGFVGGNPDQPIVVGRVFNATNEVPYRLPQHKTRSTWRSMSSPGGDGFNELMFEDAAGAELVYLHAQRDRSKMVEHDESIEVGRHRQKEIGGDESEHIVGNRSEIVDQNRTESTGAQRTIATGGNHQLDIGGSYRRWVTADALDKVGGRVQEHVKQDAHKVQEKTLRWRIGSDSHLTIAGRRLEKVDGTVSLTVGEDRHESIGGLLAIDAGDEIHLKAANNLVIECDTDVTIKGPGGFIRIDQQGVVIVGKLVKINSGGSAGSGNGAFPEEPEEPEEVADPETSDAEQQPSEEIGSGEDVSAR